ncbi:hypothetical protein NDU88_006457 [Pleurodeles waltl]|uniref:Uncharacterized protein n=1 Tax=Pleurodeles waltl TaxID=8319 RepID=A0AAV7QHM7_PLEWA|nr:hypothetical protein NDU88_006457 [Pleurodeles waltl]
MVGPGPQNMKDRPAASGEMRIPGWPRLGHANRGAEYQRTANGPGVRHSDAALCGISLRVDELPSRARLPKRDGSGLRYPVRWPTVGVVDSGRLA